MFENVAPGHARWCPAWRYRPCECDASVMKDETLPDPVPPATHHGDPRDTHAGFVGALVPSYEEAQANGCTCRWNAHRNAIVDFDPECPVFGRHQHQPVPLPNTTAQPQGEVGREGTDPAP